MYTYLQLVEAKEHVAQCKCQVIEGGGDILPTEEAYISRSDQKDNWRLGCQVKIRNDMKIQVPDEYSVLESGMLLLNQMIM